MTFSRAVRLLLVGTVFVSVIAAGAALHFRGLGVFAELDASTASNVLAFGYQVSAFMMALILFPLYWCRLLVCGFRTVSEVDADAWMEVPWLFRISKLNAIFIPAALTPAGRQFRNQFLAAVEGMLGVFLLVASILVFALLGPDYLPGIGY